MGMANTGAEVGVVPREIATAATGLAFLEALRDRAQPAPPFAVETDIWLVEAESGRVVFEATPSKRFYNPLGTVHGGWISTLLDSAMGLAIRSTQDKGFGSTTLEFKISLVRPITPQTGKVSAEGTVISRGRRISTAEGRVTDRDGRLLVHGTTTCLIFEM